MTVTLTPKGSRGVVLPGFVRPLMKVGMPLSHAMFRIRGGKMKVAGRPVLQLTTVGARTGHSRHSLVARFEDPTFPGASIVIGSNNGSARHPAWCYNLAKNPGQAWITVGKERTQVRAESLHGAEREAAWQMVVSQAPHFGKYETDTDREIPVIRLVPIAQPG